jgi:hypothetical protein
VISGAIDLRYKTAISAMTPLSKVSAGCTISSQQGTGRRLSSQKAAEVGSRKTAELAAGM